MLSQDWQGLSVLYVCPIKALLNNLESRLRDLLLPEMNELVEIRSCMERLLEVLGAGAGVIDRVVHQDDSLIWKRRSRHDDR